jgi:hypothetical protein
MVDDTHWDSDGDLGHMALSGEYAMISEYGRHMLSTGKVHVYLRSGSLWEEVEVLIPSSVVESNAFGGRISMSSNLAMSGNRAVFGFRDDHDAVVDGASWVAGAALKEAVANCANKKCYKEIVKAKSQMSKAPRKLDSKSPRYATAINHFKRAWKHARKAMSRN